MDNSYPTCENCIFVDEPLDKDPCQECNRAFLAQRIKPNFVSKRKPKTNYDRIIGKSLKDLAEWIAGDVLNLTGASLKMSTISAFPSSARLRTSCLRTSCSMPCET
jgi:hypothetical protein